MPSLTLGEEEDDMRALHVGGTKEGEGMAAALLGCRPGWVGLARGPCGDGEGEMGKGRERAGWAARLGREGEQLWAGPIWESVHRIPFVFF